MSPSPFAGAIDLSKYRPQSSEAQYADVDDVTKTINLYDEEIAKIDEITADLIRQTQSRSVNYEDFQRQIKERFAEAGFVVDVVWYHTNIESVKMPEIVIKGRTERIAFDHDKQVHQVTNDLLGLGQGGVIKTDKGKFEALMKGSVGGEGHKGHGH